MKSGVFAHILIHLHVPNNKTYLMQNLIKTVETLVG